jgi:hypothetical protein
MQMGGQVHAFTQGTYAMEKVNPPKVRLTMESRTRGADSTTFL